MNMYEQNNITLTSFLPLFSPKKKTDHSHVFFFKLPSGKHTKNYGKSPFSMDKSMINPRFASWAMAVAVAEFTFAHLVAVRAGRIETSLDDATSRLLSGFLQLAFQLLGHVGHGCV